MTKKELKQELYHYIATQCSAISINTEHRLVYHYNQMEKVGEFIYNLEEKRIAELENKIADIKANCDYVLEGKEVEYREERNKLCADFENMKATLESKIAELKEKLKEKLKTVADKDLSFVAKFDALEKENAELCEQLLVVSEQLRLAKEMPYSAVKKFAEEKTQEQLTKATELLQRFIKWARTENCEKFDVILADAEQFLQADVGTKNYEEQDKILKTRLL